MRGQGVKLEKPRKDFNARQQNKSRDIETDRIASRDLRPAVQFTARSPAVHTNQLGDSTPTQNIEIQHALTANTAVPAMKP
ncbi:unnamed protein product, partial [Iphiclides podalirius]